MTYKRHTSKADYDAMHTAQNGRCGKRGCENLLVKGRIVREHLLALGRGGKDTLDNKALYCDECAKVKTFGRKATSLGSDIFEIAKTKRLIRKAVQPKKPSRMRSNPNWPKRPMNPVRVDRTKYIDREET